MRGHSIDSCMLCALTAYACSGDRAQHPQEPMMLPRPTLDIAMFPELPLGTSSAGELVHLGGFSGLQFEGTRDGTWQFLTLTDRGPNPDASDLDHDGRAERAFALPDYQPRWVRFAYDPVSKTIAVTSQVLLVDAAGQPITGLPNLIDGAPGTPTDEIPIDMKGHRLATDPNGLDLESIVRAHDGDVWMGDEYRPSLVHFDTTGRLRERLVPVGTNVAGMASAVERLPASLLGRAQNRGFEGLASDGDRLYAFLQSPLEGSTQQVAPVIELDPSAGRVTAEFSYRFDSERSNIVGDAAALGARRFVVIEQNAKTGASIGVRKLYLYDLATSEKRLLVNLMEIGFEDVEKVEGVAIIDHRTIALINDDDFGVSNEFDPQTGRFRALGSQKSRLYVLRFSYPIGE